MSQTSQQTVFNVLLDKQQVISEMNLYMQSTAPALLKIRENAQKNTNKL